MRKNENAPQRRAAFPAAARAQTPAGGGRSLTRETPLRIKTFGLSADEGSKAYIRKHLGFKLGKFAMDIQTLEVHMKHESGPKGERTLACSITVWLSNGGTVVVDKDAGDLLSAFDRAADVAERTVRRTLERMRVVARRTGHLPEH